MNDDTRQVIQRQLDQAERSAETSDADAAGYITMTAEARSNAARARAVAADLRALLGQTP